MIDRRAYRQYRALSAMRSTGSDLHQCRIDRAPVDAVVMQRAWLHRRGKSTWMFEPSQLYGELIHKTAKGTVYAIFAAHKRGNPFWVGRLCDSADGHKFWATCGAKLRARSIEFEDAGEYVFLSV